MAEEFEGSSEISGVKPWERQPYESQATFAHFQFYISQDPPRSVNYAYVLHRQSRGILEDTRKNKTAPGSWRRISQGKYARTGEKIPGALTWSERALAFDEYVAEQERQKWVKRRLELREKEWDVGSNLLEKAREMLLFPVATTALDGENTLIIPANWSMRDIPSVSAAGSKLARLAADLETDKIEVDWKAEARAAGIEDPDALYTRLVNEFEQKLAAENDGGGMEGGEGEAGEEEGEESS